MKAKPKVYILNMKKIFNKKICFFASNLIYNNYVVKVNNKTENMLSFTKQMS